MNEGNDYLGARVFGLSTQSTAYQQEAAGRLHLQSYPVFPPNKDADNVIRWLSERASK